MMAADSQRGRLTVALSLLVALGCALAAAGQPAGAAAGPRADLDVKSLVVPPAVDAGATFTVTDKVKNVGEAGARRTRLRLSLSPDSSADKDDVELGGRT